MLKGSVEVRAIRAGTGWVHVVSHVYLLTNIDTSGRTVDTDSAPRHVHVAVIYQFMLLRS